MKKHLLGFAIFSLIVGSAGFVSAIFSPSKEVFVPVVETTYETVSTHSCRKSKREFDKTDLVNVRQAVLDLETKEIKFHLDNPKLDSRVALHFFEKDFEVTHYLATEFPSSVISNASGQRGTVKANYWLKNLNSYQNLYVVPEQISLRDYELGNFNPIFDETRAFAITVNSGKASFKSSRK